MKVSDFDFHLPESYIALRPAEPRDAARLLLVEPEKAQPFSDLSVRDLPSLLRRGDVLVFNDTRVIPARLRAIRRRGEAVASIEIMLHQRIDEARWRAFLKPGKKAVVDEVLEIAKHEKGFSAQVEQKHEQGDVTLAFDLAGVQLDEAIARNGEIPLPPYIEGKRPVDARDAADYQTVYADRLGSVAAPTAGLHFTDALLEAIDQAGINRRFLTLHVGAGTFQPVKSEDMHDHHMHAEWGIVPAEVADALNAVRQQGGRIIAVGTTALRLLESAAGEDGVVRAFSGNTSIFITPGYRFRAIDGLMTNFHLPKSTLFMLVSAFCGLATMQAAYAHAIAESYRFYSYGDSSLLWRSDAS
jgi:S-adenosylmethionine:tRNA ribosyltransferase-isomerase